MRILFLPVRMRVSQGFDQLRLPDLHPGIHSSCGIWGNGVPFLPENMPTGPGPCGPPLGGECCMSLTLSLPANDDTAWCPVSKSISVHAVPSFTSTWLGRAFSPGRVRPPAHCAGCWSWGINGHGGSPAVMSKQLTSRLPYVLTTTYSSSARRCSGRTARAFTPSRPAS